MLVLTRAHNLIGGALVLLLGSSIALGQVRLAAAEKALGEVRAQTQGATENQTAAGSINGPILGYVFDPALNGLRPILGIPGSSIMGAVLDLGAALSIAEVSPRQDYALAAAVGSGEVLLVALEAALVSARAIDGAAPADRITISAAGTAAALYRRDQRSIQIITGLPAAPAVKGEVDISGLPALITAMAVSDDGGLVLLAVSEGEAGSVFALGIEAGARFVSPLGRASAISFLEGTQDALIADYAKNEVLLIRDVSRPGERIVVAGERDGISKPVAVASSSDKRRVFVANAGSGAVAVLDLQGGALNFVPCQCSLSELNRLRGNSVFRLNASSETPMFLLDAGTAEPRIFFVPAGNGSAPATTVGPVRIPRGRSRQ